MYYRVTTYGFDSSRMEEATAAMDACRDELASVSYTHLTLPTILLV